VRIPLALGSAFANGLGHILLTALKLEREPFLAQIAILAIKNFFRKIFVKFLKSSLIFTEF
jgi:hypothetical protein